jgi:uncharacterized protein
VPSRVLLSGSSGFLGTALAARLRGEGWTVMRLTRKAPRRANDIGWDPARGRIDAAALAGVELVVHLAGEPIAERWTAAARERIRESRVRGTALLARTLAGLPQPPAAMLSASAIGYYGDRGEEELSETSSSGSDFLARVAVDWEAAAEQAQLAGIRLVLLRSGVVLSPRGGALPKMLLPFRIGLGGRMGTGRQWVSWVGLGDWVRAAAYLLTSDLAGPVNLVAPNPVRNAELSSTLGRVLKRPAFVPVPAAVIALLLGEMGCATVLASQRVHPQRLLDAGFRFEHPTLEPALRAELAATRSAR